jgi:hypothetical protein
MSLLVLVCRASVNARPYQTMASYIFTINISVEWLALWIYLNPCSRPFSLPLFIPYPLCAKSREHSQNKTNSFLEAGADTVSTYKRDRDWQSEVSVCLCVWERDGAKIDTSTFRSLGVRAIFLQDEHKPTWAYKEEVEDEEMFKVPRNDHHSNGSWSTWKGVHAIQSHPPFCSWTCFLFIHKT